MGLSDAQVGNLKATAEFVRKDLDTHSQDFFIFMFEKYPTLKAKFPNYKDVATSELKGLGAFGPHVRKVVDDVFNYATLAGNDGQFDEKSAQVKADHNVPRKVGREEYTQLYTALGEFLKRVPGFDESAWKALSDKVIAALS